MEGICLGCNKPIDYGHGTPTPVCRNIECMEKATENTLGIKIIHTYDNGRLVMFKIKKLSKLRLWIRNKFRKAN